MAYRMKREGKKVMMVAGDTFRAGAIEQLELWANKVGCTIVKSESKDPSAVMYDALNIAKKENYDVVLIDTAGRMQDNEPLMRSLAKLVEIIFCISAPLSISVFNASCKIVLMLSFSTKSSLSTNIIYFPVATSNALFLATLIPWFS